ncbi:LuxR C-terminal-related transcriptional regulator [Cryobacterium sp. W22_MBD10_FK3]|uniref:helix-turn-helix transcriptional regulator n=1 Tax=Cryobacterium sp. W22_MBD10_FK3 TaxID=3240273 RepID=UPI003F9238E3
MVVRLPEQSKLLAAAVQALGGTTTVVTIEGEPGSGVSWLVRDLLGTVPDFTVVRGTAALNAGTVDEPTIALIDDAQELAPEVADRAAALIGSSFSQPLLVIVAGQTGKPGLIDRLRAASSRDDRGRVIRVPGFTTQQCIELAAEHGIAQLDPARANLLTELTDGNPHHLVTVFEQLGQRLHASIPRDLPVPAGYTEHLAGRLAALDAPTRAVLELLSVVGRPLAVSTLVEIAARHGLPVSVDGALASGLVGLLNEEGQREISFVSAKARTGIRRRIDAARARALNAAIAGSMNGWARLEHRLAATEHTDDELAADLEAEGDRHAQAGRYPSAARIYSRASGVSSSNAERERRLLRAGAYAFFADDAELAGTLAESVARCSPGPARTVVLGGLGYLLGNFPETLALVQEGLAQGTPADARAPSREGVLFVAGVVASIRLATMDIVGTIAASAAASTAITATPAGPAAVSPGEARLRLAWGFALWISGDRKQALAVLRPLITLPLTRPERADALVIVGQQQFYGGHDREALRTFDLAVESARASQALHVLPLGLALRAHVHYSLGQWDSAMLDAQAVLAHTTASRNGNHDGIAHAVIAMLAAQAGQHDEAQRAVRVGARLAVERPLPQHHVAAAVAAAVVERASGHPHAVIQALAPLLDGNLDTATTATGYTGWRAMQAEALIALGSLDLAQAVIDRLERESGSRAFGYPEWLRGLLAEARGQRMIAARHFAAAVSTGDETVTPFAQALALRSLAGSLVARGSVDDGATAAREADRLFDRLGAAAYLPVAAATGAALPTLVGWTTLTPRERDTVLLASEGQLNREIAASMHVSVKTIEKHLANALAKLGLRSRRELSGRAAPHTAATPEGAASAGTMVS